MQIKNLTSHLLKSKKNFLFEYYYLFIFAFYFLYVFFPNIFRPGILGAAIIAILTFFAVPKKFEIFDALILFYLLYNMVLITATQDFPVTVGIREFCNSALPIIFYFLGKKYYHLKNKFYNTYVIACLFCFVVGVFWYLTLPDYFVDYLERTIANFVYELYLKDRRLTSFIGSIGIGMFASINVLISFYFFQSTKKIRYLCMYVFSIVISLLTLQRASYLMTMLVVVVVSIVYIKKKFVKITVLCEAGILISTVILSLFLNLGLMEIIRLKFMSFGSAISSRSHQWARLFEVGDDIYFGKGLGTMSHKAIGYSKLLINDGAYFKMTGEIGIVGLLLFLSIMVATSIKFIKIKNKIDYFTEIIIILLFLIQSIGSNSLFFQETAPLFWLSIGFIFAKQQITEKENIIN